MSPAPSTLLPTVTERTFTRLVLTSPTPTIVCVGRRGDAAARALAALLVTQPEVRSGTVQAVRLDADSAPMLAEQYAVQATPTLLVFGDGDLSTRVVGYLPAGLLAALCAQMANGDVPRSAFWAPNEALFEETVVLPLLTQWGVSFQRQVTCRLPGGDMRAKLGRVDFLITDDPAAPPLTLFENKRALYMPEHLPAAVQQASAYAQALALPSFVIAAPAGLWMYQQADQNVHRIRHYSSLKLQNMPRAPLAVLRQLRR